MDENVTITVIPDPCWTSEMEAAAQAWLDLIEAAGQLPDHGERIGTVHTD